MRKAVWISIGLLPSLALSGHCSGNSSAGVRKEAVDLQRAHGRVRGFHVDFGTCQITGEPCFADISVTRHHLSKEHMEMSGSGEYVQYVGPPLDDGSP
jgi:hypothetical protein